MFSFISYFRLQVNGGWRGQNGNFSVSHQWLKWHCISNVLGILQICDTVIQRFIINTKCHERQHCFNHKYFCKYFIITVLLLRLVILFVKKRNEQNHYVFSKEIKFKNILETTEELKCLLVFTANMILSVVIKILIIEFFFILLGSACEFYMMWY